jgi:hypothetical protein
MSRVNVDEIVREIGDWKNAKDVFKAGKMAVKRIMQYFDEGITFNQETTLCGKTIIRNILKAKELGYFIELHYVGVDSVEIAKDRVKYRVQQGGHGIPESDIEKRYEETFERLNCTEIFPGDILISRLPDPIGRACILPKYIGKAITAVDCTIIRLNDKMLPEFFIANTLSNYYNQQILSGIKGTTRLRISRRDLSLINILCPPLPLQKQFAEIATQAEATKESLRKSIENIDQVIKSLINQ